MAGVQFWHHLRQGHAPWLSIVHSKTLPETPSETPLGGRCCWFLVRRDISVDAVIYRNAPTGPAETYRIDKINNKTVLNNYQFGCGSDDLLIKCYSQ